MYKGITTLCKIPCTYFSPFLMKHNDYQKSMLTYLSKIFLILMLIASPFGVFSQSVKEFDAKYTEAKNLLNNAKYLKAMEAFKPLMVTHKNNMHTAYSCYFFANAAFKMKDYTAVFKGIETLQKADPNWPEMDDANLLIAASHLSKNNYSSALAALEKISKPAVAVEAINLEAKYINTSLSQDTLLALHAKFPNDSIVTKLYSEYLLAKKLKETAYKFTIATLLPFNLKTINIGTVNRENQYVLDMYEGMRMATADLAKKGIVIDLRAYDTDKDTVRLLYTLGKPEFKTTDLVIGPIFNQQVNIAARQMEKHKVAVVNPLSDNIKAVQKNKNALLFKASRNTQATKTAEFAYNTFENKTALVIYSNSPNDTLFARIFKEKYTALGGKVFIYKKVDSHNSTNLTELLGKDTLANAGFVLVCHGEEMVASNIVTAVAIHNTNTPVITYYDWLDYTFINFDQFEKHNFHFIYPGYVNFENENVVKFRAAYLEKINVFPSEYAYWGYDLMVYYGTVLQQYGKEFYTKLPEIPEMEGTLIEHHLYGNHQDNQLFPILKFENSKLVQVH